MNPRILQEAAVRYFLEVVNTGSISDAAAKLHVVPSAVSRQISRLESELNATLFERQSRGMVPSRAGELLAAYARRSLLDAEHVSAELDALRADTKTTIRIACTEGFATEFLPRVMTQFRRDHPSARFNLAVAAASVVTRQVRETEVDLGLTFSLGPARDIHVKYSQPAPMLAVVAPSHVLARRSEVSLRELFEHPLALPGPNSTLRQLLDIYCSREGINYKSVLDSETLETLLNFSLSGEAVTFSGELFLRSRLARGQLVALPVPELHVSDRNIEVQTLARRDLPLLMEAFIATVKVWLPAPSAQ